MKFLFRVGDKVDSLAQRGFAWGFRLTGWKIFIICYRWRRNILLSGEEMVAIAISVREGSGSFLVFGAGNDSVLWAGVNHPYPTVFLEDDSCWMKRIGANARFLNLYQVTYTTHVTDLLVPEKRGDIPPGLDLPEAVRDRAWDIILVDAPQGWGDGPGRLQSIFEASRLLAPQGRIFVHDCDREGERYLIDQYLGKFRRRVITHRLWMFEK